MLLTLLVQRTRRMLAAYHKWQANKESKALERRAALEWEQNEQNTIQRIEEAFRTDAEIEPPWIAFPYYVSWNQGWSEYYYDDMWFPYIKRLPKDERVAYLEKWPIPEQEVWQQWPERVFRIPYATSEEKK